MSGSSGFNWTPRVGKGGRPSLDGNEFYENLKLVKSRKNVRLEKLKELYDRQVEQAKIEWENEYARAIVDAKNGGLSNYGIGKATGQTANDANKAQIEWAFQRVKDMAENAEWGEQIG